MGESVASMLIDSHIHLYEYEDSWVKYCDSGYLMIAVSDDVASSLKTVDICGRCPHAIPAVGVHPWNADKVGIEDSMKAIEKLVGDYGIYFLGEVGLDRALHPETFEAQLRLFKGFLEIAAEYGLGLSIHAAGAWRDVLDLLRKYEIATAVFHWYTGPLELVDEIVSEGFFIGVNPALLVQKKHEAVVEKVPTDAILTESDGPYRYRGLDLGPELLPRLLERISQIKRVSVTEISERVAENFRRLISSAKK
ncbi:MAG: TatD family hydrolase [Sulfolobales archaeon]|nr:TatD family hydrolase [Sulfolobales archaeon]MCX8209017.1 TatD family hydrolase [Sulfolobales archaeon]MDW8011187.1 TatD family hydrolase [Sulfolobales archaeon]